MNVRSILLWILAAGGGLLFLGYVWIAGQATLANPAAPDIKPAELIGFGTAAGTLLATNLGAVLGISARPPGGGGGNFRTLAAGIPQQPWAQLIGAIFYVVCLALALYFYWQAGWAATAAEILKSSLSTLFGVFLGALAAVLGAK
jgi:hypothetical protein